MIYIINDGEYSDYTIFGLLEGPDDFDFNLIKKFVELMCGVKPERIKDLKLKKFINDCEIKDWEEKRNKLLGPQNLTISYMNLLIEKFGFKLLEYKMTDLR